jgi:hypothetical protein
MMILVYFMGIFVRVLLSVVVVHHGS